MQPLLSRAWTGRSMLQGVQGALRLLPSGLSVKTELPEDLEELQRYVQETVWFCCISDEHIISCVLYLFCRTWS